MLKKKLGIEAVERDWYDYSIEDYFKINSTLIIPEGCLWIGFKAFWGCERLKKVEIPKSVKKVGDRAFKDCTCLEKVVISEGVVCIGEFAFYGCWWLGKVIIPKSVERIEQYAFDSCLNAEIIVKRPKSLFQFITPMTFIRCKSVEYAEEETRSWSDRKG